MTGQPVQELIAEVENLRKEAGNHREKAALIDDKVRIKILKIEKLIKNGETTHDPVRDYVYTNTSNPSPELEAKYWLINNKLGEHIGQFILMITRYESRHCHRGPRDEPRNSDWHIEERLHLGIIDGPSLLFEDGRSLIPVTRYAAGSYFESEPKLIESNFPAAGMYSDISRNYNTPFVPKHAQEIWSFKHDRGKQLPEFEIIFGNEALTDWCLKSSSNNKAILVLMAEAIGKKLPWQTPDFLG